MKRKPLDALTGMRFFAAAHVVAYHLFFIDSRIRGTMVDGLPWPVLNIIDRGCTAVNFFFVLSGFILAYNYSSPEGKMNASRHDFWLARAARIIPMYYVALLLAAPFFIQDVLHNFSGKVAATAIAVSYFFNITLLNGWYPEVNQVNPPGWTLSAEAFFYLCFPFVLPWLGRLANGRLLRLAVVLYLIAQVPTLLFNFWVPEGGNFFSKHMTGTEYFYELWVYSCPLLRIPDFIVGMIFGLLFQRTKAESPGGWWTNPAVALGAFVLALGFTVGVPWMVIRSSFYTPLCVWVIWTLARRPSTIAARALSLRPMVLLGEASYGVYLFHYIFVVYFSRKEAAWNLGYSLPMTGIVFAAILIAVTLFSIVLFYMVEEPARRWLRKKYQRGNVPIHPAASTLL